MFRFLVPLLTLVSLALSAPAAMAAKPPQLSDFQLRASHGGLPGQAKALDGPLNTIGVQKLLDVGLRQATRGGPCVAPSFGSLTPPGAAWCFDGEDTASVGGDDSVEWIPQGVSSSADAQQDETWGKKKALLVSWYDARHDPAKGVRISFLDPATGKYTHVLLVEPFNNSFNNPSYRPVPVHAGGIVWYGNFLYVADTTRGVRVFDMRQIYDLRGPGGNTSDKTQVGRHNGTYYGFGYSFVMPQTGYWTNAAGPDNDGSFTCQPNPSGKYSNLSLDRSAKPDRLIAGEYCRADGALGRVAKFPIAALNPGNGGVVKATEAYRLPSPNIQGATAYGGRWYLTRSDGENNGTLLVAKRGRAKPTAVLKTTSSRATAIGPEDLSVWPSQKAIWSVTEHAGRRVLYSTPFR